MKVTILKKSVKEGVSERTGSNYKISSLFVKFEDEQIYANIVKHLQSKGATTEQIEKFCKPNTYRDRVTYAFNLNCSSFTFERVDTFGVLDAAIIFAINDQGYINAKILVKDKKEQVLGYDAPESNVEGWEIETPPAHYPEKREIEEKEREARERYNADPFAVLDESPKIGNATTATTPPTLNEMMADQEMDDLPF